MKANHLQRSGDIMSVSASRAWIGGPITDSGDPTQLGRGAGWQMAGNGTGLRPVIPDRTTFVGSGTMSKTIACCNDEPAPAPHSIFDVQLGGRSVRNLAARRDPARRTSVPGTAGPDHAFGPPRQQLGRLAWFAAGQINDLTEQPQRRAANEQGRHFFRSKDRRGEHAGWEYGQ
jgi:hypothetical protein